MVIENVDYLENMTENMTIFGGAASAQSSADASAQGTDIASVELINYAFALSFPGQNISESSSSSSAIASSQ